MKDHRIAVLFCMISVFLLAGDGDYAEDWSPAVMNVDTKGNLEVSSEAGGKE